MAVQPPLHELLEFLQPYGPDITKLALAARATILREEPATELIYDAYNAVTTAFSFSDRLSDAFCHVAVYTTYVNIGFMAGARLPDPSRRLEGSGRLIRHVRIRSENDLRDPAVRALIRAAIARGREEMVGEPRRPSNVRAIVKAIYPKRRRPQRRA
jgi:hypothetical protein